MDCVNDSWTVSVQQLEVALAANETAWIVVDGFSSTGPDGDSGPFTLTVVESACGNGFRESGEHCDDGNTASGDGCNATCHIEPWNEVEPNDDRGSATAIPGSVRLSGPVLIGKGSLDSPTDVDFWSFEYVQDDTNELEITVETSWPTPGCGTTPEHDTYIEAFSAVGTLLGANDNNPSTGTLCSGMKIRLVFSGTFTLSVAVSAAGGVAVPEYFLWLTTYLR